MEKHQAEELSTRIILLRNIAIFVQSFSLVVIGALFFYPNILSSILKVLSATIAGTSFIGILTILVIARKDSTVVLFFTILSTSISWFFIGICIGKIDGLIQHSV
jgi:hypothetical protein